MDFFPYSLMILSVRAFFECNQSSVVSLIVVRTDVGFSNLFDGFFETVEVFDYVLTWISWVVTFYHHCFLSYISTVPPC